MTIFEKLYFTLLIVNLVVLFISICVDGSELYKIFVGYIGLTILYEVVRVILLIWGIKIDLFPSVPIM